MSDKEEEVEYDCEQCLKVFNYKAGQKSILDQLEEWVSKNTMVFASQMGGFNYINVEDLKLKIKELEG